jgi:hypothetical protein
VIAYGLLDTLESESDRRLSEGREKVWQRRDAQ